jgi:hypothetical protein
VVQSIGDSLDRDRFGKAYEKDEATTTVIFKQIHMPSNLYILVRQGFSTL